MRARGRRWCGAAAVLAVLSTAACSGSSDAPDAPLTTDAGTEGETTAEAPSTVALPRLGDVCGIVGAVLITDLVPDAQATSDTQVAPEGADDEDVYEVKETCTADNGLPATQNAVLVVRVTSGDYRVSVPPEESLAVPCGTVGPVEVDGPADGSCAGVDEVDGDRGEVHVVHGLTLVSAELQNPYGTGVTDEQLDRLREAVEQVLAEL